jgi:hypothetical protein
VAGARLADRLLEAVHGHVQFLVLTCPEVQRRRLAEPGGAALWASWLRQFWLVIKARLGGVWCYQRSHPAGDDGQAWAVHANLIFVTRKQGGMLPVRALAAAWAGIVGYQGEIDLHAEYADTNDYAGRMKLKHHCRYIERHFPGWSWPGLAGRWYGKRPKRDRPAERSRAAGYCPQCGKPIMWSAVTGHHAEVADYADAQLVHGQPLDALTLRNMLTREPDPDWWAKGEPLAGKRYRKPSLDPGG